MALLLLQAAFDSTMRSGQHGSGLRSRFPHILSLRKGKPLKQLLWNAAKFVVSGLPIGHEELVGLEDVIVVPALRFL